MSRISPGPFKVIDMQNSDFLDFRSTTPEVFDFSPSRPFNTHPEDSSKLAFKQAMRLNISDSVPDKLNVWYSHNPAEKPKTVSLANP
eukprot:353646_1